MSATTALEVDRLEVAFRSRPVLHGVSFEAPSGQLVALTGPNGSGKTTLLRAILGLLSPRAGGVRLRGRPVPEMTFKERARAVAWVPQEEAPRDNVPILEYVLYARFAHLAPFAGETDRDVAAARRALHEVGLADRADEGVLELSGGERQRLLLARALTQQTPVLLLDEPTAHLDIAFQLELLERVRALAHDRGTLVLAALHDLNLAARFADRVIVLSHGRRVADGLPSDVLSPGLLRTVWGVDAVLRRDPRSGQPYLLPQRSMAGDASRSPPGARGRVHVIGGGGAATPILVPLTDAGWSVSLGGVPLLDSDTETAEELGLPIVAEIPFSPLSDEVRERHRAQIAAADAVVVAPFAIGPGNIANLEDVRARPPGSALYLLGPEDADRRDFTGGAGARAFSELRRSGGVVVPDLAALTTALEKLRPLSSR